MWRYVGQTRKITVDEWLRASHGPSDGVTAGSYVLEMGKGVGKNIKTKGWVWWSCRTRVQCMGRRLGEAGYM